VTHPLLDPKKYDIEPETLRELFDYCEDTGALTWRKTLLRPTNWNRRYAGKQAGYINHWGRRVIAIIGVDRKKRRYYASVIAWAWMTGEWPVGDVDHRDLGKANDRWDNLRPASRSQNLFNAPLNCRNTSGFKGVHFDKARKKFSANIQAFKVPKRLGRFETIEEAVAARAKAAEELHGEFARTE
jgi:HNH endonuclease